MYTLYNGLSKPLINSCIGALLQADSYNAAILAMIDRRIRESFWQGLWGYACVALLLLVLGWWLLGIAGSRYGMMDAVPEIAHYVLGLAIGQISALWFTVIRCAPMAFLDYSERRRSGEWAALAALKIDGVRYVCVPWLIAATVTAVGFWCLYYILYLLVEQAYPIVADWIGMSFVAIHSGAFASITIFIWVTSRIAIEGFVIAWVALVIATQDHDIPMPGNAAVVSARRSTQKTHRVSVLAIIAVIVVDIVLYRVLK